MDEETKRILEDHEKRIKTLEGQPKFDVAVGAEKQISVKELLLSKKPTDDNQKTLVIGYYLERYRGIEAFNIKDLEDALREAREKVPDNINDKVNKNIRSGYMMETKEKKDKLKAWNLTSMGERFVENDFKKE